uniref:Ubiquitin-conjugating enzyme E2 K n=1 Tax=Knipowitschia caucasica TaxID=637954 RepID=A0AAV2MJH9_KNICA
MHNPYVVAVQGYGTGLHAPGETGGDLSLLKAAHNMIKAHARAWHNYDTYFRPHQMGKVSVVLGSHWVEPQRATEANINLCQESMEAVLGWFANPIFVDGDYPLSLKSKHGAALPAFTDEEKLWVRNTADFFALSFGPNDMSLGQTLAQYGQTLSLDLRRVLTWIKLQYDDPPVLVAEAGWFSVASETTENTVALYLIKRFVNQVLQAIRFDRVRVIGYTAWSLLDGFEWNHGYARRRGLFYVDFSHPKRNRSPKTSALYYRDIITKNGFPDDKTSQEIKGLFPCEFHWGIADPTLQVRFHPFSPQFTDPRLYMWNVSGDGTLRAVPGVTLQTRPSQCTEYLAIRNHLRLFASTGASHYRFALNWSLVLPQGDLSNVNADALRYYRCMLSELTKMHIKAVVVLYYPSNTPPNWGLPAPLQASGGWLNHSTVEAFRDYASLCFKELETEKSELKGALGFIALNHFTTRLVVPFSSKLLKPAPDHNCGTLFDPTWVTSKLGQAVVPWGLRRVLNWVTKRYGRRLPIIVTASGIDDPAAVDDKLRQNYVKSYLQEALKAHQVDGVNLQGFYVWRLEDGLTPFGLFTSASHQSKAKVSVSVYRDIISKRGKKNNNPAHPDYTPSIFPQAVLKELTKSTTLDRFKRAQKRKAPSTTLVSRKERKARVKRSPGPARPQTRSAARGTMANIAVQRIKREFKEVLKSEETSKNQIKVDLVDENFTELKGEIAGPPDTPYEGGRFQLEIKIPETYPFNPPKVRFITNIWHPNISSVTGAICLDILKDQWAAAMTLRTVLLSLQALMAAAEPDDPQDAVVANQYKQNPEMFKQTARLWSHVYAGAPVSSPEYTCKIDKLCAMGFDKNKVIVALSSKSWDEETATELLLN